MPVGFTGDETLVLNSQQYKSRALYIRLKDPAGQPVSIDVMIDPVGSKSWLQESQSGRFEARWDTGLRNYLHRKLSLDPDVEIEDYFGSLNENFARASGPSFKYLHIQDKAKSWIVYSQYFAGKMVVVSIPVSTGQLRKAFETLDRNEFSKFDSRLTVAGSFSPF